MFVLMSRLFPRFLLLCTLLFSVSLAHAQSKKEGAIDRKKFSRSSSYQDDGLLRMRALLDSAERLGPDRVDAAFLLVEDALVWSINNGNAPLEARCYGVLGDLFVKEDQCDLATDYFEKCVSTHPDGTDPVVLRARLAQARCLVELKRYLEARTALDFLKQRVDGTRSEHLVLEINDLLARILSEIGQIDKANDLLQENMDLAQQVGDKEAEVKSRVQLGTNQYRSDREQGYSTMSNAWTATDSITDASARFKARKEIAGKLEEQGEYEQSLNFRQELAEEVTTESADTFEALSNQMEIGTAQRYTNQLNTAIGTYNEVLTSLPEDRNGDPRYLDLRMSTLKNLSETYLEVGNADAARRYLDRYMETMELANEEKKRKLEANLGLFSSLNADVQRIKLLEKDREINEKRIALLQALDDARAAQLFTRNATIAALAVVIALLVVVLFYRQRALRKEQLAARLIELRSLRAQMNPHFIFNALNAVNHYIAMNDERRSNQYLTDLSGLMRKVLTYSELEFIELEDEVELLQQYLRLEHDRFQEKFSYTFTVDPALVNAGLRVPPMLVQPFIENAVWHGLRHKEGHGALNIAITDSKDRIAFTITDDGIGRTKAGEIKRTSANGARSKGIDNARNRIALVNSLYHTDLRLTIDDASPDGTGTRVHLEIPKQLADVH